MVASLEAAAQACGDVAEAFVIGGAQIYAQAPPLARRVLATEVHAQVEGDAFFPLLPAFQWKESARAAAGRERLRIRLRDLRTRLSGRASGADPQEAPALRMKRHSAGASEYATLKRTQGVSASSASK